MAISPFDQGAGRWKKWRPTVSLAQHEDTLIHRIELLHSPQQIRLAELVKEDITSVSPDTGQIADAFAHLIEQMVRGKNVSCQQTLLNLNFHHAVNASK